MAYKYPYIANPKMYAAVMYACKLIRETKCFNKAVQIASDTYGVDEEKVKKHIRERQSAGQKNKITGRKYRWYVLCKIYDIDADVDESMNLGNCSIIRATSYENAAKHFSEVDWRETYENDCGGNYAPCVSHVVVLDEQGYSTKAEAQNALKRVCVSAK